jgi:outer membrane protein assembly factor BamB
MRLLLVLLGCGGFAWRLETPALDPRGGVVSQLRADGEVIHAAGPDGIQAFKGGSRLWAVSLPNGRHALAVGGGKVIVTGDGRVRAYQAADGALLWEQPAEKASPPSLAGDHVAWVSNHLLFVADAQTGNAVWKQPIAVDNALMRAVPFARVAPAIAAGKVCAGLAWELNILDLATGEKGAHEDATGGGVSASPVSDGARCYFAQSRSEGGGFAAGSNTVHAVDPAQKKFAPRWQKQIGDDDDDAGIANLLLDGSTLFVATNYRIVALDKDSGAVRWTKKGAPVFPAASHAGTRASRAGAFAFDAARGIITNDAPGTNLAVGDGKLFFPSSYGTPARDVVTALDAATGAYLWSWDARGAEVLDLAVAQRTLWVATSNGLFAVKL